MLILQFIIAFGVMLFLHEFGHFIVSKAFGIEVEEFGFGLPPRICKLFTWKGTDFTLNLLPFGAFVKPKGEFDDPSQNSLREAAAWKQIHEAAINWPRAAECDGCAYEKICGICAADALKYAEPGQQPKALCERTRYMASRGVLPLPCSE